MKTTHNPWREEDIPIGWFIRPQLTEAWWVIYRIDHFIHRLINSDFHIGLFRVDCRRGSVDPGTALARWECSSDRISIVPAGKVVA